MSRLKSSRGMTFMELLCAVLILMMSTALVLVGGMNWWGEEARRVVPLVEQAQARQIVDRLCSSENISQISDMNMNTYTEGRNSGTVETTLVITYFEIMS